MIIKGTDKIRGVLDLSSIGLQLTKKTVFSISDNDYWNSDVQSAIKMGFITSAAQPDKSDSDPEKVVKCVNNYHRPITIKILGNQEIKPKHTFTIKEKHLSNPDINAAVKRGMIGVTQVIDPADYSEGFLELGDLFKKQNTEKQNKDREEADKWKVIRGEQHTEGEPVRIQKHLETNEDLPKLNKVEKKSAPEKSAKGIVWNPTGDKPVPAKGAVVATGDTFVKVGAADDRKGKPSIKEALRTSGQGDAPEEKTTEIVNAEERPIDKTKIPNVIDDDKPKSVNPVTNDPKKNTIVVNPTNKKVTNNIENAMVWDGSQGAKRPGQKDASSQYTIKKSDVEFVDEDSDNERIAKHPVLGKKPHQEQPENDPIAPDSVDENRIAKHPVLGKEQNNTEIDDIV